jgi:hypothetical protein
MELHFDDFALIIRADGIEVPYGLMDETLFLTVKKDLVALLAKDDTSIHYFGYVPDNTADGQDELLTEGVFFRIIGYEKNLGVDLESSEKEVIAAFKYLVENYEPRFTTIIVEEGETKKEVTIELLYQDVFV